MSKLRSIRATGIQMLRSTGFANLLGSGEFVDAIDPSEDEGDYLEQDEAELMDLEEEGLETKPDLGSLVGDDFEQECQ